MSSVTPAPATSKVHVLDILLMIVGIAAVVAYGIVLYVNSGTSTVDWGAFVIFIVAGAALMIGGYFVIRASESHRGEFSGGELLGAIGFGLGMTLIVLGALPDSVTQEIREHTRALKPLPDFNPPVVNVVEDVNGKTLKVTRIGNIDGVGKAAKVIDADKTRLFVLVTEEELTDDATSLKTEVNVPADAHGKVWFEVDGRRSLAQDF